MKNVSQTSAMATCIPSPGNNREALIFDDPAEALRSFFMAFAGYNMCFLCPCSEELHIFPSFFTIFFMRLGAE